MKLILLIIGLVLLMGTASATIRYIDTDGSGDYDCNGADDHVQILDAINASISGDTVWINASIYDLNATIYMNASNVTLTGDSQSSTKLEFHMEDHLFRNTLPGTPATDLTISDIWFDGDSLGDKNGIYFISISDSDSILRNITVTGHSRDGIRLSNSKGCLIENCTITGNGVSNAGIFLDNADNTEITGNTISTGIGHGIDINTGNSGLNINNNTITGFTTIAAIYLYGGSHTCTIKDNLLYGNRDGVRFLTGYGWTVTNNIIRDNTRYGIVIEGQQYTGTAAFSNNLIYDNGNRGITSWNTAALDSPKTITFTNELIDGNGGDGILVNHVDLTFNVSNCIITNNGDNGLRNYTGTMNSKYNNIWNNVQEVYNGTISNLSDIYVDPLFYNSTANDFHLNSTTGTWSGAGWEIMGADSPCIDTGDPTSDYSNEPALNGGRINMGAYGNTIYASKSSSSDVTVPTYSDVSTNTTEAGESCLFSIKYNDSTALHPNGQWIFSTNNTGPWVNDSAINWTATPEYANKTKTLNTTHGKVIGWRVYGTDNNGNVNNTPIYTLTVQDTTALVITLLSQTPSTICQNCTGNISIEYGISHSSAGLNNTSVSFIYRDYDHDLSDSNHSIRPPLNNLASEWNFDGRILRGANRNESLNFENNATITDGDIYSWSGLDENNSEMSIVYINDTYTKVYINSTIHRVMPQMHYIDRSEMQEASKTTIAIHKNQDVLVKFWNFEIYKGNTDFLGVGYTDTTLNTNPALHPSDANPVNYHYISSGYDPSTGNDPLTSGYAVYMGSLNATGWVDHVYSPHANSSYTRGFINNTLLHSYINTTNISYVLYTSNTPSNKGYFINVTDVATSSNVSFANTSVLWAGDNAMSAEPYTPNIWFAFMKDNVSFDHKLFVADNNDLWGNSTINSTTIGEALFPPTKPSFYSFHNGVTDYDMNGSYSGTFNVQISAGSDPDGGDVFHNVTIHYGNGTCIESIFNTSCNASCLYMNVSFDSTPYYSDTKNYTFKVVATDDEGESVTTWLGVNFSLGLHVSGTVYGGDNIGLQDVSMTLGSYSTTTASDGTFLFTGISDGSHTLTSYIDGYDTLSKTVNVSGVDVTGQDFYYDIIVDRGGGGGGGSGGFISIVEVLDEKGEVIGKAIAIGKPGDAWFTIDIVSISRLLSGEDAKNTWSVIVTLSIISILAGLFDTSKTARPELLLVIGFVGMGFYAIYQSKLAVVIGFG